MISRFLVPFLSWPFASVLMVGRLGPGDFPKNRQHQKSANQSKRRHEVEIISEALVEQFPKEMSGEEAAEVLKGIDHSQGKSPHAAPADVHRGCRAENGMGRVGGKGNEHEKHNRRI